MLPPSAYYGRSPSHRSFQLSPPKRTPQTWLDSIKSRFGIIVRRPDQTWSPSGYQSIDAKCIRAASFLFYQRRSALEDIEQQLQLLSSSQWTLERLFELLKEHHNRNLTELQSPISSQSRSIRHTDSHGDLIAPPALSLQARLHTNTPMSTRQRPQTPELDPDTEEDEIGYNTAPQSPSFDASLRSGSRKRPSPFSIVSRGSPRRKFSSPNSGVQTSPTKLRSAISAETSFASRKFPSFPAQSSNDAILRSFETTITVPDVAPSSSFGPTSSDQYAFEKLSQRGFRANVTSASEDNSSMLYGVSSSIDLAMNLAVERAEQRERELARIQEAQDLEDSELNRLSHDGEVVEDFRVSKLQSQGFFFECEGVKSTLPFHIQYECARLSTETGIGFSYFIDSVPPGCTYDMFWQKMEYLCKSHGKRCQRSLVKAWDSPDGAGLTAKLFLTPSKPKLMSTMLARGDPQKTSRFHKKFGKSRFLYLFLPDFKEVEFKPGYAMLYRRLRKWLLKEKDWLNRKWRAIHVEAIKARDMPRGEKFSYRVVFFAVSGFDIPSIRVEDVLGWFIDFECPKNRASSFCKIYARLQLGLSNTKSSFQFTPDQVLEVQDLKASRHSEPREFNDESSGFDWRQPHNAETVMNDGCSLISLGAAIEVWKGLGQSGPVPSVFQARINGAKGIWIRSADVFTATARDKGIWIQVSASQRKFARHRTDTPNAFEPLRWTFEVVGLSRSATPATLHQSFVPILEDRGVPRTTIENIVIGSLEAGRIEILKAMKSPVNLRAWCDKLSALRNTDNTKSIGSLPPTYARKAIQLLESGFHPGSNRYLAEVLYDIFWDHFARVIKVFAVPLAQSTIVKGIADWTGTLKPGEIHLAFSRPFDIAENEECHFLNGQEVLVTRHPCLRASDIQKVVAKYAIELSHIRDVVVFSTLGPTPLAGKLQGGDYDGDDFWICWDASLVAPFKNAPHPTTSPLPESLGIQVDKRTLAQVMYAPPNDSSMDSFLEASFKFSLQLSLLGLVTVYHDRLIYKTNNVRDSGASHLADLHGLIIDSTKNGYTYTKECFLSWLKHERIVEGQSTNLEESSNNLPEQAWKVNIESWETKYKKRREYNKLTRVPSDKNPPKPNLYHILDYLHFKVIEPHVKETLRQVESVCGIGNALDRDLCGPYHNLATDQSSDPALHLELEILKSQLLLIKTTWSNSKLGFESRVADALEQFNLLQPSNTSHVIAQQWMKSVGYAPSFWDLLKASMLYAEFFKHSAFVWHVAGSLLCYLKAQHSPNTHHIIHTQYMNLRSKKELVDDSDPIPADLSIGESDKFQSCQSEVETEFFSIPEY